MPRAPNADPSADALRKREARAKKKAEDPEGYTKKIAEASQAYRNKKKADQAAAPPEEPPDGGQGLHTEAAKDSPSPTPKAEPVDLAAPVSVDELARHLVEVSKATAAPILKKTAVDYATRLLFLLRLRSPEGDKSSGLLDLEALRDVPALWQTIWAGTAASGPTKGQLWSIASKLTYAAALAAVLRRLKGFEAEHAEASKRFAGLKDISDQVRAQNLTTEAERGKFAPWSELTARFAQEANGPTKLSPRALALFGLYVAIPPRRVADYRQMRVAGPGRDLDPAANWVQLNTKGVPARLVYNQYKTVSRYGQFVHDSLPPSLAKVLATYIRDADLADGDQLFPANGGAAYSPSAFSTLVGNVFDRVTGKRTTVNILRHSAITHFLGARHSVAQKEAFATQMGHSVGMQALYDRVDAGAESSEDDDPAPAKPVAKAKPAAKAKVAAKKAAAKAPPRRLPDELRA
jgi:hypothetical protein